MSQPSFEQASVPTVLTKKSAWNIYTVLLLIALIALLVCNIMLYLEIKEYGGFGAVKGSASATPALVSPYGLA